MPTDGDYTNFFLWKNKTLKNVAQDDIGDLHIAVSNSKAETYDYDMNGLNKNSITWLQIPAIVIPLENHAKREEVNKNTWDSTLEIIFKDPKWNKSNYNENNFNCLDFVTEFLINFGFFDYGNDEIFKFSENSSEKKYILQNKLTKSFLKKQLSKNFIEPKFYKSLKYLNLLVNLNEQNIFEEHVI